MITQMHKMISFSSSSSLKKGLHEHVLNFLPADTINSGGLTRETLTKHQTQCTVAETKLSNWSLDWIMISFLDVPRDNQEDGGNKLTAFYGKANKASLF